MDKLKDLNYYLFEQLDRISNDDLQGEELDRELARAKAITDTATQIIKQSQTQLRAAELFVKAGKELPDTAHSLLGAGESNNA